MRVMMAPYIKASNSVMDFGCGQGSLLSVLTEVFRVSNLSGCDISNKLCENARIKVPSADIRVADLEDLPFNDDSIDCGFATEVLEHMETPVKALKEIHEYLSLTQDFLSHCPIRIGLGSMNI